MITNQNPIYHLISKAGSFIEELFLPTSVNKSEKDSSYTLKESGFFDFSFNGFTNPFHDLNCKNTFLPLPGLGLVGAFLLRNTSYGRLLGAISLLLMGGCTAGKLVGSADDTGDTGGLGVSGTSLASADAALTTGVALDALGYSVASVGDMNGDGNVDIAVSAPYSNGELGSVYIQEGPVSSGEKTLSDDDPKLVGDPDEDTVFGGAIDGAGDIDGDGYNDVLICTDYHNGTGAVYVAEGPVENGVTSLSKDTNTNLVGEEELDYAGFALAGGEDFNDDESVDILMGAYGNNGGAGAAYVVYGPLTTQNLSRADVKIEGSGFDFMGYSVGSIGDENGDGYNDIIAGGPFLNGNGGAYVVDSPLNEAVNNFSDVGYLLNADVEDSEAGTGVWGVGDLNGDGYDDVAIGDSYLGSLYLVVGPIESMDLSDSFAKWTGESDQGDAFGYSATHPGDVDRDGYEDLVVGAPDLGQNRGAVYMVYGPTESGTYEVSSLNFKKWFGESDYDLGGYSLSGAGDINNDGYADVIIGAPNYTFSYSFWPDGTYEDSQQVGLAYLIFGS